MGPQELHSLGIAVIPVMFCAKKPLVSWQKYQKVLPTTAEMARWFRPGRKVNAAAVCGWQGLTVIDFDDTQAYLAWQRWAMAEGETARRVALETYRTRTSRGMHLYLFVEETPRCGHFQWGDIKGRGGCVLIPPSVHPSGAVYTAVDPTASILRVANLTGIVPDPPKEILPPVQPTINVFAASSLWPRTIVEEIKARYDLLSFFPDARPSGGNGRWYTARCPFHDDREPSLWIDTEKGICGCYAGCFPHPVDVIGLYARLNALDNKAAIKQMARDMK